MFFECSSLWKRFLVYDLESTGRQYGVALNNLGYYWQSNVSVVPYRECWFDLRTQEIFIGVSKSVYGEAIRRHLLISAEESKESLVQSVMERFHHKEWRQILCVKPTHNAAHSLLLVHQCIGPDGTLLCKNMSPVYNLHKLEFLTSRIASGDQRVFWTAPNALSMLLECTALIAIAEYFKVGCVSSRRAFSGCSAFVTDVLDRARLLAERYKHDIWRAFNFDNVVPRRLIDPPNPELFKRQKIIR